MSSYASTSIDRRADYYARCAELIARDPLDFYTRAEKGRRIQASRIKGYHDAQPQASSMPAALAKGVAWLTEGKINALRSSDSEQTIRAGALAA